MRIADSCNAIKSFQAKVDLTPSVGSVYTGQITEIKNVTAVVLFRKPADIRIQGYLPVVHSVAFDMLSNGDNLQTIPRLEESVHRGRQRCAPHVEKQV